MDSWPFGERGGLTVMAFTSEDPLVCAHQAVRLKILLALFAGRYEETCMVMNRLELVYLCAGRSEDADKIALIPPALAAEEQGMLGRLKWWWQIREHEARFARGQLVIDEHLADLHRRAPWKSGQDPDAVWGMT